MKNVTIFHGTGGAESAVKNIEAYVKGEERNVLKKK